MVPVQRGEINVQATFCFRKFSEMKNGVIRRADVDERIRGWVRQVRAGSDRYELGPGLGPPGMSWVWGWVHQV